MIKVECISPPRLGNTTLDGLRWCEQMGFDYTGSLDDLKYRHILEYLRKVEIASGFTHYYDYGTRVFSGRKRYDRIYAKPILTTYRAE